MFWGFGFFEHLPWDFNTIIAIWSIVSQFYHGGLNGQLLAATICHYQDFGSFQSRIEEITYLNRHPCIIPNTYDKSSNYSLVNRSLMVNGSWLMDQGSWLMHQGLWLKAHGSWPRQNWLWVPQALGPSAKFFLAISQEPWAKYVVWGSGTPPKILKS